jgi:hypothetical protein
MIWKAIGQSIIGTSHLTKSGICDDALHYRFTRSTEGEDVLICCVSDGAGSASHAAWAASYVTLEGANKLAAVLKGNATCSEHSILQVVEELYEELAAEAIKVNVALSEFSCTFLGCVVEPKSAVFFQIGDGAIVRNSGNDFLSCLWWPQNGEYQNTTTFLIDDNNLRNLLVKRIEERIDEVAIFSDGLQHLALNSENQSVHQPFFANMFKTLRHATNEKRIELLNQKLQEYLNSSTINDRTDDDKTLFLASRFDEVAGAA